MKNKKGFTLIELLVVIAIIGLLSTLAIVSLNTARQKSRDSKRQADVRTMQSAIELYINDNGAIPGCATADGCAADDWPTLQTALATYLVGAQLPVPPGSGGTCAGGAADFTGDCYAYCGTGSEYLLTAQLENNTDISGDVDGTASYAIDECFFSDDTENTAAAAIDCEDATMRFCLGTL